MGNFNRDGGGRGGNKFGGRDSRDRGFGGRDAGRPMMHKAVCDDCGSPCEVPFRPTAGKPIYCEQCFGKGGKDKSQKAGGNRTEQDKGQFEALNAKLDKIIKLLTPVAATAPVQAVKETKKDIKEIKLPEPKEAAKKPAKEKKAVKKKVVVKEVKVGKKK